MLKIDNNLSNFMRRNLLWNLLYLFCLEQTPLIYLCFRFKNMEPPMRIELMTYCLRISRSQVCIYDNYLVTISQELTDNNTCCSQYAVILIPRVRAYRHTPFYHCQQSRPYIVFNVPILCPFRFEQCLFIRIELSQVSLLPYI